MSRDGLFCGLLFHSQLSARLSVVSEVWKPPLVLLGLEWPSLAWRTWEGFSGEEATCLSPLCLSGIVGAVDSTAQRPSHSPGVQALPLPLPPTSIYPESLWYPALLSQPDLYYLIFSKAWEGRRQEGPLAKEHIHQLPQDQISSQLGVFTGLGEEGVMECSGQELRTQLGVMRAPRRWEEALSSSRKLSYMASQNTKPYRERAQDAYGIPCPEPSAEGFLPITILLWFRT